MEWEAEAKIGRGDHKTPLVHIGYVVLLRGFG